MKHHTCQIVVAALLCFLPLCARADHRLRLSSPDSSVTFTLNMEPFAYDVYFRGEPVLVSSPLGLNFLKGGPLHGLQVNAHQERTFRSLWHPVWGKSSSIENRFRELTVDLQEASPPHRRIDVIIRCYNEGVAFRYVLPAQHRNEEFVLTSEHTGFHLPATATVWVATYKNFHSAYEAEYTKRPVAELQSGELIGLPLLFQAGSSRWGAITEAELSDWAGMYLQPSNGVLTASLSTGRAGESPVRGRTPHPSPWRVIMLADRSSKLLESNLVENLSSTSKLHDTSWIKPGMMAWDHWWSGGVEMTNAANERFIDFASRMGFPYQLVDWQWYGPFNTPEADITRPAQTLNMPSLLRYGADKHVRLWLWLHSKDVDRAMASSKLEAAFAMYEKWGIAGVKIDFMESDDQERVLWYEKILKLAATHHLMVDFHGAYKPTGLEVSYPNLLTREAVLGNEYNKFSSRDTPLHKATLPFTRGLAGPMDYTPGGFLNRRPAEFKPQTPTEVMGTRAAELALFVVYFSPLTCVADDPSHYLVDGKEEPGLGFLRDLPTVWDETRALSGSVGEHVVVARRKGADWWLGGITGDEAFATTVPLNFLGSGQFIAHIYRDAHDPDAPYTAVEQESRKVDANSVLPMVFRAGGGGIAVHFHRDAR